MSTQGIIIGAWAVGSFLFLESGAFAQRPQSMGIGIGNLAASKVAEVQVPFFDPFLLSDGSDKASFKSTGVAVKGNVSRDPIVFAQAPPAPQLASHGEPHGPPHTKPPKPMKPPKRPKPRSPFQPPFGPPFDPPGPPPNRPPHQPPGPPNT
jgi:hypothetical protein